MKKLKDENGYEYTLLEFKLSISPEEKYYLQSCKEWEKRSTEKAHLLNEPI